MHLICRHLRVPLKVAALCASVLLFIAFRTLYDSASSKAPYPPRLATVRVPGPSGPRCPAGFYTREELRPHVPRPPQDPRAPGAHGEAFVWPRMTSQESAEKRRGHLKNQFNQFASDRISLHRDLGRDTRHTDCLEQKFWHCPRLPTTSVIIVFHNEAWSTLLRTVYSVLHTAPAALLAEVLLVDDASTDDHLKARLDQHVERLKIVRVLRQVERKGLVAARLMGMEAARGQVLTFLDSHCECFHGWLEPLLARIAEKPTAVVSPAIANIDAQTLKFIKPSPKPPHYVRGNFDWQLTFGWEAVPDHEKKRRKNETYPIRTPTFAGGLFSVSKSYFELIGTYDDQMEFWGGENLEMSFRVWQCGGQLEIIPCSVVGHVFRKRSPHWFPNGTSVIARNLVRLAEVWLDEYRWIFYRSHQKAALIFKENTFGNVTGRRNLRAKLNCRDFSWYMKNIYPEANVPDIVPERHGRLENIAWECYLDAEKTQRRWKPGQVFTCKNGGQMQYFELTSRREVRLSSANAMCVHANAGKSLATLERCRQKGGAKAAMPEQAWTYTQTKQLKNPSSDKCLTVEGQSVVMRKCVSGRLGQSWLFI